MSGLKLVLPSAFTDTTMPVLRDDPILTAGSVLLLDPAHPARPMGAGIANNAPVPNIAHAEASALLGASFSVGALDNKLSYSAGLSGAKGKLERTGKGGIHGIVSQATPLASGDGAQMTMNNTIMTYLFNNRGHSFYVSFWDRLTRANAGTVGSTGAQEIGIIGSNTGTAAFATHRADAVWQVSTSGVLGTYKTAPNVAGSRFANVNITNNPSLLNGVDLSGGAMWGAYAGTYNNAVLASRNTFWPSLAFYRLYVEDLTVSGRSYATVDALDAAEYTKQVLTAGGRYYGDTFTDPATIA